MNIGEKDFLEQLEVCCPVCGSNSFDLDETNTLSCNECDYSEPEQEPD